MPNLPESDPAPLPVELIDTPFGFQAHRLDLSPANRRLHHAIMSDTLEDPRVLNVINSFERIGDEGTRNHSLAVGWLATAGAIELGLDERDASMAGRAEIAHDLGKLDSAIQEAIHSPYSFHERPDLRDIVETHAMLGSIIAKNFGFGPNESMVAASHHGFQTERPAYGLRGEDVRASQEPDGYTPPTQKIAQLVSGFDQFHALATPTEISGRKYRRAETVDPLKAFRVINTLAVDDDIKRTVPKVTGYDDIRHSA